MTEQAADAAGGGFRAGTRGLLVQLAGFGDLIMALPAIESLQAYSTNVHWTVVTRPPNCEVVRDRVGDLRALNWPPDVVHASITARQLLRLRRERFDVAIHLYDISGLKGALGLKAVLAAINPRLSIGRTSSRGFRLFDVNWDEGQSNSPHEVDLNLGLIRSLGVPHITDTPTLAPEHSAVQRMVKFFKERLVGTTPCVVLFPGGTQLANHWPVEHYAALARKLHGEGLGVCVIGGRTEVNAARRIVENVGNGVCNLADRLSMQDVMGLLSLVSAYVGNASGPTHVAAALGTPCVALYRRNDTKRFSPRGPGRIRVLHSAVECIPCERTGSGRHTCMAALAPEMVFEAVLESIRS